MRRITLLVLFIVLLPAVLLADAGERIWVYTDSTKNITSFNLEKTTYIPTYSTTYVGSVNYGDPLKGTYSYANVIGNFGCIDCGCEIEFTVTTDGRFVSQSDPTKYRDFQLALMPRLTDKSAGDMSYAWDYCTTPHTRLNSSSRVMHTEKGSGEEKSLIVRSPSFDSSDRRVDKDEVGDKLLRCSRWWCDMLMILDTLTAEDYRHLAEVDDYVTRLTISWQCDDDTHPDHRGSFTLVLRGYFGVPEGGKQAKVMVTPDPIALNMNILNAIGQEEHIAQILVLTDTSTTDWSQRIFMFLSSDPDAWVNDVGTFSLKQVGVASPKTIPYSVIVRYNGSEDTEYTGADTYTTAKTNGKFLNLHTKSGTKNRDGYDVYLIDYSAEVYAKIPSSD